MMSLILVFNSEDAVSRLKVEDYMGKAYKIIPNALIWNYIYSKWQLSDKIDYRIND